MVAPIDYSVNKGKKIINKNINRAKSLKNAAVSKSKRFGGNLQAIGSKLAHGHPIQAVGVVYETAVKNPIDTTLEAVKQTGKVANEMLGETVETAQDVNQGARNLLRKVGV